MAFDYQRNKLRGHYEEDFNPESFLDEYYQSDKAIPGWDSYVLSKLHEAVQRGLVIGGDCLEVGCGPTVHRLASVSRVCDTLTYSDISIDSLEFLKTYRSSTEIPSKLFKHLFQHIAKLEGYENVVEGGVSVESRLKVKMRDVVRCDVLEPNMMETKGQFDVIVSCGCVERASVTFDDFIQCVKHITEYLKSGGVLILSGYMGGNFFKLGHDVFPCLQFDLPLVNRALRKANMEIMDMDEEIVSNKDEHGIRQSTNCSKCFFSISRKE